MSTIEKLRSVRIPVSDDLNIAAFDTIGTILIATGLARYNNWNVPVTIFASLGLGFGAHIIFKQDTPLTKKIMEKSAN